MIILERLTDHSEIFTSAASYLGEEPCCFSTSLCFLCVLRPQEDFFQQINFGGGGGGGDEGVLFFVISGFLCVLDLGNVFLK